MREKKDDEDIMIKGHGDDAYRYGREIVSNFSSNVMPGVNLDGLRRHLCERIGNPRGSMASYPEPEPYTLERALEQHHGLSEGEVCVTNGATEAIYLIAQAFRESHSAVLQPTFSEYADACVLHAHRLTALYALPTARQHYALPADVRMLWLCNPNNPTGGVCPVEQLEQLIIHNPQVCFVIDQSYGAFTQQPLLSAARAAQHPNVLQLHSLTKRYAVPGLRLGYVTAHSALIERLRTCRMPWSVNQVAIDAGLYLLDHDVPADMPAYLAETQRLSQLLQQLECIEVWPTQTHFMLCRLRMGTAAALKDYLARQHGLLIRDASNFRGLDEHFFRIATQSPAENDALVQAIGQWMLNG